VNAFKSQRVFGRDLARISRGNEPEALNEKYFPLLNSFSLDSLDFAGKRRRARITEILGQSVGADRRPIEEVQIIRQPSGAELAIAL
jgi:hypothetical protein